MVIEDVVILGAGASKSDGAPLQSELFETFFYFYVAGEWDHVENLKEPIELISNFFYKVWNIDIGLFDKEKEKDERNNAYRAGNLKEYYQEKRRFLPSFEECLGILDLANIRKESICGLNKDVIQKTRNAMIMLIAETIKKSLQKKEGPASNHRDLIKRLIKEEKLEKTAFISLNYDILIDNALSDEENIFGEKNNYYPDYGILFDNAPETGCWSGRTPIYLLKIHGSLNWMHCPTCNSMKITIGEKGVTTLFEMGKACEKCDTPLEAVIVPPTFYKEMSNLYLQQIILKAEQILRSAKTIYFCGYSFPDADMHVKYVLKKAELYGKNSPFVYVINNWKNDHPHALIKSKPKGEKLAEENRYLRFFKDRNKIFYSELRFDQFSDLNPDLSTRVAKSLVEFESKYNEDTKT